MHPRARLTVLLLASLAVHAVAAELISDIQLIPATAQAQADVLKLQAGLRQSSCSADTAANDSLQQLRSCATTVLARSPDSHAACPAAAANSLSEPALQPKSRQRVLAELVEENDWLNSLTNWLLPASVESQLPRFFKSWWRNYVGCMALYCITGGLWAYYVYFCFGSWLFEPGKVPALSDMAEQMRVSFYAIPTYSVLPSITEAIVERGWTRVYARVGDVGLLRYVAYFFLYMALVELGVYWMHRLLHDIKAGYNALHYIHHKYNKEHTLSPFAGLAFHPLDGILQAFPYLVMLFVVPMHFLTHLMLLFMTGVWTTNIHDCVHGKVEPIMGAGYHTIHHTTYKHNYGHYFVYMDWLFGSLITPEAYAAEQAQKQAQKAS